MKQLHSMCTQHGTRMHSSRMRTGRSVTVSGGGGLHPRRNFGEKKLEKKLELKKIELPPPKNWRPLWKIEDLSKNWRPPQKLETPKKLETPWKIGDPLKNWRPPQNWRPPKNWRPPGRPPPLLTESQTGVKILPWPNFVAAGNYEHWAQTSTQVFRAAMQVCGIEKSSWVNMLHIAT